MYLWYINAINTIKMDVNAIYNCPNDISFDCTGYYVDGLDYKENFWGTCFSYLMKYNGSGCFLPTPVCVQ